MGSTPATNEKDMASGTCANATVIPDRIWALFNLTHPHEREKNEPIPVVCFQHVMSPTGTGKDESLSSCWPLKDARSSLNTDADTGERMSDSPCCLGVSMLLLSATTLEESLSAFPSLAMEIPSWSFMFDIICLLFLFLTCSLPVAKYNRCCFLVLVK